MDTSILAEFAANALSHLKPCGQLPATAQSMAGTDHQNPPPQNLLANLNELRAMLPMALNNPLANLFPLGLMNGTGGIGNFHHSDHPLLLAAAAAALSAQKSPFCPQSLPPLYQSTNGLPSSFMSLPNPLQTLLLPMAAELAGTAPMAMKTPVIGQTAEEEATGDTPNGTREYGPTTTGRDNMPTLASLLAAAANSTHQQQQLHPPPPPCNDAVGWPHNPTTPVQNGNKHNGKSPPRNGPPPAKRSRLSQSAKKYTGAAKTLATENGSIQNEISSNGFPPLPVPPSEMASPIATRTMAPKSAQSSPLGRRLSVLSGTSSSTNSNISNGFSFNGSIVQMQKTPQRKPAEPIPQEKKDDAYYERRRKNNDAAKRSRDQRRMKEEITAQRATFLEQENAQLRQQIALLRAECAKFHAILLSSTHGITTSSNVPASSTATPLALATAAAMAIGVGQQPPDTPSKHSSSSSSSLSSSSSIYNGGSNNILLASPTSTTHSNAMDLLVASARICVDKSFAPTNVDDDTLLHSAAGPQTQTHLSESVSVHFDDAADGDGSKNHVTIGENEEETAAVPTDEMGKEQKNGLN